MSHHTNSKGLIIGTVLQSTGRPARNYLVTLKNRSNVRITGNNGKTEIETVTNQRGIFSIGLNWSSAEIGAIWSLGVNLPLRLITFPDITVDEGFKQGFRDDIFDSGFADVYLYTTLSSELIKSEAGGPDISSAEGIAGSAASFISEVRRLQLYPYFKVALYDSAAQYFLVASATIHCK